MNKPDRRKPASAEPEPARPLLALVLKVARQLEHRLEAELSRRGLSGAKATALGLLAEASEPLPLGKLAHQNACVRSNITQLVDRLEGDGLVRRVSDPDDRRVRRAALTAPGRKANAQARRIVAGQERAVATALSREEAATLAGLLRRLVSE